MTDYYRAKEIKRECDALEEQIDNLKREYKDCVEICKNKDCDFNKDSYCSWTWFIAECSDYKE